MQKSGGIYLANYLITNNFNVELIDSFYSEKDRFHKLLASNPKAVIISTTFIPGKQSFAKLVSDIRDLAPDVAITALFATSPRIVARLGSNRLIAWWLK